MQYAPNASPEVTAAVKAFTPGTTAILHEVFYHREAATGSCQGDQAHLVGCQRDRAVNQE